MGNTIPPFPIVIEDNVLYDLCGTLCYCDKYTGGPDSESWPICFAIAGSDLKEWFNSGKNGTCGPTPAGQYIIDFRFKATSITVWTPA
jgi:hypothetical protein